ncbi:hypothetical protein DFP91_1538 [Pseudorhodoplanes sinuspersici]|nr:hypothetical protein DFP91_1538 [Pseudorhodoplanes sinuspersici]
MRANGDVVPNAQINVYREQGGARQALKADYDGLANKSNPFTADSSGYAFFHAPAGRYRIVATADGFSQEWRQVPLGTAAAFDIDDLSGDLYLTETVFYNVQVDTISDRAAYDEEEEGFVVLVSDTGDGRAALFTMTADPGVWSDPAYLTVSGAGIADTKAAAATANIGPAKRITTLGYNSPGDGGGAEYDLVATQPDHDGYVLNGSQYFAITKLTAKASQFGAFSSDTEVSHAQLQAALDWAHAVGGCLIFDDNGPYQLGAGLAKGNITNEFVLEWRPGAELVLKQGEDVGDAVFDIRGPTGDPQGKVTFNAPKIDCQYGVTASGDSGASAIAAWYLDHLIVNEPDMYGGATADNANSDSGVAAIGFNLLEVSGGIIRGFGDKACYLSGNPVYGLRGSAIVRGLKAINCQYGVGGHREMELLQVIGCNIEDCISGVHTGWTNAAPQMAPARRAEIIGNSFRNNLQCVDLRGITRPVVNDNLFLDWGYHPTTGLKLTSVKALSFVGARGATVNGNTFEMRDRANVDQIAIHSRNETQDATLYTGGNHSANDNVFRNVFRAVLEEENLGVKPDPSLYLGCVMRDVTSICSSSQNASSIIEYTDFATGVRKRRVGPTSESAQSVIQSGVTVTHTGTTSETVLITVPIPAGALGPNGGIRIMGMFANNNSAGSKTHRIRWGAAGAGASGVVMTQVSNTTSLSFKAMADVFNKNAVNVQDVSINQTTGGWGPGAGAFGSGTVNTNLASEIVFTVQLSDGADNASVRAYRVEVFYGS